MRVTFEVFIGDRNFGVDYTLSAEVDRCVVDPLSLRCESYTVYHNSMGDQVFPWDDRRVAARVWSAVPEQVCTEAVSAYRKSLERAADDAADVAESDVLAVA